LIQALLARLADEVELAVSATTRARREGEVDGVHYWFISDAEFDRRLADGEFLESFRFPWGKRSGTLLSELDRIAGEGGVPLLELELNGSLAVKERVPGAVTIFVDAPLQELERRLRARATESAGEIEERIRLAAEQRLQAGQFGHVVVNDERDRAASEVVAIVQRELDRAATMAGR
jgi:guanylate kinase